MLYAGIAILTGTVLACYSPSAIDDSWLLIVPAIVYFATTNLYFRLSGLFLGSFLWAMLFLNWQINHSLPDRLNNTVVTVVGEIDSIPKVTMQYGKPNSIFYLNLYSWGINETEYELPTKIRLSWKNAPGELKPGQVWRLKVKLKKPHGFQNPGSFDYEKWLFYKGVGATGYVLKATSSKQISAQLIKKAEPSLRLFRYRLNENIKSSCNDCQNSGLIQALSIGYRGDIPSVQKLLLQRTGVAHLIAISGLHIGIIAGFFYFLGTKLWCGIYWLRFINKESFALSFAWISGFIYSFISGFDLPAQRAMLMLSVILITKVLRLPFNLLNSIIVVVTIVLLSYPLVVLSASFWLTLCALLIISLGIFLMKYEANKLKLLVYFQLLFSILFIPISLAIFGQIHSASFLANLIAVPAVSFIILPFAFLLLMFSWLPDEWLLASYQALDHLISYLLKYLTILQDNGLNEISLQEFSLSSLVLLFFVFILLLLPKGVIKHKPLIGLLPLLLFANSGGSMQPESYKVTVLDVGMGTSVIIQTANHSLVYDFGAGNNSGYSLGEWVVVPYLKSQGLIPVDRVVLSHSDLDHIGGLYAVSNQFVGVPVFSGSVKGVKKKIPAITKMFSCHGADKWLWDGVLFEFIGSQPDADESTNNQSCILKVSINGVATLLTGDIEKLREQELLDTHPQALSADVLIAPHHGSNTSSSSEFIKAVGAKHVVFSVGYLNRWGFPREKVVKRYIQAGAEIYRTDQQGAVLVKCNLNSCDLSTYRGNQQRLWY